MKSNLWKESDFREKKNTFNIYISLSLILSHILSLTQGLWTSEMRKLKS